MSKNCPRALQCDPDLIRGESLDEGEVENRKHGIRMYPLPIQITKNQTSFFAHEVFEYFLPAQSRQYDGTPSRRKRRKPRTTTERHPQRTAPRRRSALKKLSSSKTCSRKPTTWHNRLASINTKKGHETNLMASSILKK